MTSPIPTRKGDGTDQAALIHEIVGGQPDLFGDLIAPYLTQLSLVVRANDRRSPGGLQFTSVFAAAADRSPGYPQIVPVGHIIQSTIVPPFIA